MSDHITKADLLESETKVLKEDQKLRHKLGEKVHKDYLDINEKVGNNDKELALLKQSHNTMKENHIEIKKDMKEMRDEFQEGINEIKNIFYTGVEKLATKEEHQENKKEIKEIKTDNKKVLVSVISGLLGLIYLFIDKYF